MTKMDCRINVDKDIAEYLYSLAVDKNGQVEGIMFSQLLVHLENRIYDTYID